MKAKAVVFAVLWLAFGRLLPAQSTGAPSSTGETGLFSLLSAETLPPGEWAFLLSYDNWDRRVTPLRPRPEGLSSRWGYDRDRLAASAAYGWNDRLELALSVPYESLDGARFNHAGTINGRRFVNRIDADGPGDLRLGAKWRLFRGGAWGSSVTAHGFLDLPTGEDDQGIVTGDPGFGLGAAWNYSDWVFDLTFHDPGDAEELIAGVGYVRPLRDRLDWITELVGTLHPGGSDSPPDSVDLTSGGRFWFGENANWALGIALRAEFRQLFEAEGHAPFGGVITLAYRPQFRKEERGACCRLSGDCTVETPQECAFIGGMYGGNKSACPDDQDLGCKEKGCVEIGQRP
jgi:hypothetical protein